MAKGLQDLLDYEHDDVEDVFCLSFEVRRMYIHLCFFHLKIMQIKRGFGFILLKIFEKIAIKLYEKVEVKDIFFLS